MSDLKNIEIFLVPLQNLGTWCGGGTPSKQVSAYWENGTIPWVSPKDMKVEHIRGAEDTITEKAVKESATNLLPAGSVLVVTRSGILRHTFPVAVTDVPVTINQDIKALVPSADVDPKYVAFGLRAFSREILHQCSKQGTTVNSIETKELLRFQIPLFSSEVQTRIVAEIEKQFSRLDEAVANLKRVKANLKRYKAAVLKFAVEGKLTEEWRKQHPDVEPADKLLERITTPPRPNRYETRTKDLIIGHAALAVGNPNTKLPNKWVWSALVEIARMESGHTPSRRHPEWWEGEIPWIGIADARENHCRVIHDTEQHTNSEGLANSASRLLPKGTVCVSRTASVGYVTVMGAEMATSQDFVNWIPTEAVTSEWLRVIFSADVEALRKFGKGTVHKTIYFPEWLSVHIALPPLAEQHQIVAEVERRLSIVAGAEAQVDANLRRADRLRQSILKQAFSGQLVPQNPNDEPRQRAAGADTERRRGDSRIARLYRP